MTTRNQHAHSCLDSFSSGTRSRGVSETHSRVTVVRRRPSDDKPVNYYDSLINVGCRNPIKTVVSETSFFPYLEISPDTYGRTVNSPGGSKVTIANDGVFARLVQSLYDELDETRRLRVSQRSMVSPRPDRRRPSAITSPSSGLRASRSSTSASTRLSSRSPVRATRTASRSATSSTCYKAALPATPTGADPANRLGEQLARWEVIKHVFETRFLPSIPANGYCAERGHLQVVRFGTRDSQACGGVQQCTPPQLP